MKKTKSKIGVLLVVAISGLALFKFNIINIENLKFFPFDIKQKIVREGYLDEVWDFEKVPGENGYYNWMIGLKADDISAARVASGAVVTNVKINMDYKFMEDYNQHDGHTAFINFIEEYEDKHN